MINADASQVYRDLRVLSARPSVKDEARMPHRLFGYIDGAEACSAARWAVDAAAAIDAVHAEGGVPVLVGGTGLYLRTLLDGIAPVPEIDPDVRRAVRALPLAEAYEALRREDAESAARLAPADTTRVMRALEVVRSSGAPLSHWQRQRTGGVGERVSLSAAVLLPDRQQLFTRCDHRLEQMFDDGAVEEVVALLARDDIAEDAPVRRAIGVPEIAAMLSGDLTRAQAINRAQLATRQYAKRQYTWFRNQSPPGCAKFSEANLQFYFENAC